MNYPPNLEYIASSGLIEHLLEINKIDAPSINLFKEFFHGNVIGFPDEDYKDLDTFGLVKENGSHRCTPRFHDNYTTIIATEELIKPPIVVHTPLLFQNPDTDQLLTTSSICYSCINPECLLCWWYNQIPDQNVQLPRPLFPQPDEITVNIGGIVDGSIGNGEALSVTIDSFEFGDIVKTSSNFPASDTFDVTHRNWQFNVRKTSPKKQFVEYGFQTPGKLSQFNGSYILEKEIANGNSLCAYSFSGIFDYEGRQALVSLRTEFSQLGNYTVYIKDNPCEITNKLGYIVRTTMGIRPESVISGHLYPRGGGFLWEKLVEMDSPTIHSGHHVPDCEKLRGLELDFIRATNKNIGFCDDSPDLFEPLCITFHCEGNQCFGNLQSKIDSNKYFGYIPDEHWLNNAITIPRRLIQARNFSNPHVPEHLIPPDVDEAEYVSGWIEYFYENIANNIDRLCVANGHAFLAMPRGYELDGNFSVFTRDERILPESAQFRGLGIEVINNTCEIWNGGQLNGYGISGSIATFIKDTGEIAGNVNGQQCVDKAKNDINRARALNGYDPINLKILAETQTVRGSGTISNTPLIFQVEEKLIFAAIDTPVEFAVRFADDYSVMAPGKPSCSITFEYPTEIPSPKFIKVGQFFENPSGSI